MESRSPYANLLSTSPRPRWFYSEEKEDGKDKILIWKPYDWNISDHIETDHYLKLSTSVLPNRTINFQNMTETLSNGEVRKVLRGTWFFKGDEDSVMVPYSTEISDMLETEFLKGNFHKKEITHKPPRDVIMHADLTFKQYRRTKKADRNGRDVERGYNRGLLHIFPGYAVPPHAQTFRVNLEILMTHPLNAKHNLPLVFERCITVLMKLGPQTEGIFRLSGSAGEIEELKRVWDGGQEVDLSTYDVHTVAGLLKLFIRELPDPLCKGTLCKSWMSLARDTVDHHLQEIRLLLTQLPKINLRIFGEIFRLLWKIACAKETTKMVPTNLAICWAPNLFPSTEGLTQAQLLTTVMIEHAEDLFKE